MKTDYTITPEYDQAMHMLMREIYESNLEKAKDQLNVLVNRVEFYGSPTISSLTFRQAQADQNEYFNLLLGAVDRHDPTQTREPLIRTVCKIAARILFVLLLVGVAVGVMA